MGFEMSYQAIPVDCDLLDRALHDVELGQMLCLIPHWMRSGLRPAPAGWTAHKQLLDELRALTRRHPGLERRNCDLERWWDKLHYLLSATRRGTAGSPSDQLLDKAIRGGTILADHARAPQGSPVRYLAPDEVHAIAAELGPLTIDHLRPHYDPDAMSAAGVYKFHLGQEEFDWKWLPTFFESFRHLYQAAANHCEFVIACLD